VVLAPQTKFQVPPQIEIWSTINQWIFSIFRMSTPPPPRTNIKPPIEDFLTTVLVNTSSCNIQKTSVAPGISYSLRYQLFAQVSAIRSKNISSSRYQLNNASSSADNVNKRFAWARMFIDKFSSATLVRDFHNNEAITNAEPGLFVSQTGPASSTGQINNELRLRRVCFIVFV